MGGAPPTPDHPFSCPSGMLARRLPPGPPSAETLDFFVLTVCLGGDPQGPLEGEAGRGAGTGAQGGFWGGRQGDNRQKLK